LTPSARSANLIAGDGTKNGFSSSEQRTGSKPKSLLDRKSPIQVRIHFPPGESLRTFGSWTLSMRIEQQGEVLAVICLDGSGEGGQQIANHRLKKLALSR
jgi:hypothetical protein